MDRREMCLVAAHLQVRWEGAESVFAVAYDTPIPGYDTWNTLNMRLWSSKPSRVLSAIPNQFHGPWHHFLVAVGIELPV